MIENKPGWLQIFAKDFSFHHALPKDWDKQIIEAVQAHGQNTVLDGNSATSLEAPGTKIELRVVMGECVLHEIPWLFDLYQRDFLSFASEAFDKDLIRCSSDDDAVNINSIKGTKSRYEWHRDTNPVTGLLFVETLAENAGGALVFKKHGESFRIYPQRGMFYCFDAREVPHAVEPLRSDLTRTSVPMNFYLSGGNAERDSELNKYLRSKS